MKFLHMYVWAQISINTLAWPCFRALWTDFSFSEIDVWIGCNIILTLVLDYLVDTGVRFTVSFDHGIGVCGGVSWCAGGGAAWCSVSLLRSSSFTRARGECGRAALRGRRYRGRRTLYTGSRAGRTSPTMNRAIFYQLSGGVGAPRRVAVRSNMTL